MSDEIATGREGREIEAGFTPLRDAPRQEAKTYSGDQSVMDAANDLTAARGTSSEAPAVKIQYRDRDGKPKRDFAVTAERAGRDASEYHKAQAVERDTDAEINFSTAVLETRATANAVGAYGTANQALQQTENSAKALGNILQNAGEEALPEQQPTKKPADTAADGVDQELATALANPKVKAVVDQHVDQAQQAVGQAQQAAQAYAAAIVEAQQLLPMAFAVAVPELANVATEQIPGALQMLASQNPQRFAQVERLIQNQMVQTRALQERTAAIQHEQRQQYAQRFESWSKEQDRAFENKNKDFADPQKAPALRAEVVRYLTNTIGIPEEKLPALWQHDLARDAKMQQIVWDATQWQLANERMKDAVAVPKPPVLRPGVSRSNSEVARERLERLHDRLQNTTGEAQLMAGMRLMQAKRAAR